MARNSAHHSKPDGEMDAHGGEENAVPMGFDNDGQGHNEPEGSIGRNVQRVEASSAECETGTSHSGVKEPTSTQAERRQQKEREKKWKGKQQKRATTWATLEEALARVDTAGASLDTLTARWTQQSYLQSVSLSTAALRLLYGCAGGAGPICGC
jgi:hypothetical protein